MIVPSLTFVATANAIRYTGATPVFADIAGLERPWLSADEVATAIGTKTRAIVNMTYGGHPGDSAALAELAADRGLMLLEDAAHGLGGSLAGRQLGTFGLAGAYSFFSNKNLAVGEGGMVVTDDDELAAKVRLLRSHGMTSLTWDRHRGQASGYDVVELGFNYRIDEPRATLATERLARRTRKTGDVPRRPVCIATAWATYEGVRPTLPAVDNGSSANHLFTVVLSEAADRDAVRASLAERGVQTSLHYPPVHRFTAYGQELELPVTDEYAQRAVTLPLFPTISEEQIGLVVDSLEEALTASLRN